MAIMISFQTPARMAEEASFSLIARSKKSTAKAMATMQDTFCSLLNDIGTLYAYSWIVPPSVILALYRKRNS